MASDERTLRVSIGPQPIVVVLVGLAGAMAAFAVLTAAQRQFGWLLACAVVAALVEPLVALLERRLPRFVAILLSVLVVGAAVGGVVAGLLSDLDNQYARLTEAAPKAAAEIEQSDRFGRLARDFRLEERVDEILAQVDEPTSGLGNEAASAAGTYFLCGILTAFLLAWGPRISGAAVQQIGDPYRRRLTETITREALSRGRGWILAALGRALVAGTVMFVVCHVRDLPGPVVLAVVAAACAPIPGFGVLLGALPALLLEAGLGDGSGVAALLVVFAGLQVVDLALLRHVVTRRTLLVGPAVLVIAVILGFDLYGFGGAVYGAVLSVLVVALLDAASVRDVTIADAVPELVEDLVDDLTDGEAELAPDDAGAGATPGAGAPGGGDPGGGPPGVPPGPLPA